jgi:hypothetical protein
MSSLSASERKILLDNSLERVINTAAAVALRSRHPDAGMSHDDLLHVKALATKLWNEARNAAFIQAQRDAERAMVMQRLWTSLFLPFEHAYPIVRQFVNADFKLVFDPRIIKWCADNHAAILAANPEGK